MGHKMNTDLPALPSKNSFAGMNRTDHPGRRRHHVEGHHLEGKAEAFENETRRKLWKDEVLDLDLEVLPFLWKDEVLDLDLEVLPFEFADDQTLFLGSVSTDRPVPFFGHLSGVAFVQPDSDEPRQRLSFSDHVPVVRTRPWRGGHYRGNPKLPVRY